MQQFLGRRSNISIEEEENQSCFPQLNPKGILIGYIISFLIGFIIQIISIGSYFGLFLITMRKFAFFYTLGNIISVLG